MILSQFLLYQFFLYYIIRLYIAWTFCGFEFKQIFRIVKIFSNINFLPRNTANRKLPSSTTTCLGFKCQPICFSQISLNFKPRALEPLTQHFVIQLYQRATVIFLASGNAVSLLSSLPYLDVHVLFNFIPYQLRMQQITDNICILAKSYVLLFLLRFFFSFIAK